MKPCLYGSCLAPSHCKDGAQECHINAYACTMVKQDQMRLATGKGIGRTYANVRVESLVHEGVNWTEQVET